MLCLSAIRLGQSRRLLQRLALPAISRFQGSRGLHFSSTGHWPEPITQQTLDEFLRDINYFEEPTKMIDIGLTVNKSSSAGTQVPRPTASKSKFVPDGTSEVVNIEKKADEIDAIMDSLSHQIELPALDFNDAAMSDEQVINLATYAGIYRDLFGQYTPNRDHIRFRKEQADRLNLLIPHHWITDQPYARVDRHFKEQDPQYFFRPAIDVIPSFINKLETDTEHQEDLYAHVAYYGNIVPASEAIVKPSISIDGQKLNPAQSQQAEDSNKVNQPGDVSITNFHGWDSYLSVLLLNLDSVVPGSTCLNWFIANISAKNSVKAEYDELCSYLPVHGVRGLGYSRYVFLVFQHKSKLNYQQPRHDCNLESRRFDVRAFMQSQQDAHLIPIGLRWFQTTWDESSNKIFHEYLKMKAPVYEHVQKKPLLRRSAEDYPGAIPFHIYLDSVRDKKELNERALLERLKKVNPSNYADQYIPPKVPETIFEEEGPSWMRAVTMKKKNRVGLWRGLRPASAILPLNNNADLDHPIRPLEPSRKSPPGVPSPYPRKPRIKRLKDLPYSKPINENSPVYIQDSHEVHLAAAKKIMGESTEESKK